MKNVSSALSTILAGSQFEMADCYTFILTNGQTLRYTTADQAITDQATGHVFSAGPAYFSRSKVRFQTGVQVDELEITLTARPGDAAWSGGPDWLPSLRAGSFDGAEVQLDRAYMSTFGDTSAGLLTMFYGRVTEVDVGRTRAIIKVNTHLELLNMQWPWRLFQPGCSRTLFDAGCTLAKSSFGVVCHVTSGSTVEVLHTDLAQADDWASLGTITFSSGALSGQSYALKRQVSSGNMSLLVPLSALPAIGDTLTAYPGCNKTRTTCSTKFSNLQHFAGMPFVPVPETAA